jgi:Kef-type K+ transport system membrane component KefB
MSSVKRFVLIVAVCGLMQAVQSFGEVADDPRRAASGLVVGVGFVLIASWFTGRLFASAGLPKLTGYLAMGLLAGPAALGLLQPSTVDGMALVNGMAVALIALTGGSEMDFRTMRPLFRSIAWITLVAVLGTSLVLAATVFALTPLLPFLRELPIPARAAVSAVIGVVLVAQSPAVVVAIRAETGADGPVARTVLGVVVLADLVVVVLFALLSSVANAVLSGEMDFGETARAMSWELFGSLGIGTIVGMLLSAYLRFVGEQGLDLFVLAVCFMAAEVGRRVHLDPLLLMLAAGMFVENVSRKGHALRHAFEDASLPVYILFFTVAGACIDLGSIPMLAVPTLVLLVVRGLGLHFGTALGARIAQAPPAVVARAGLGLLPQAGLAIALSLLFGRLFPTFGAAASALTLNIVAVNQLVAPALFRIALVRSGEAAGSSVASSPPSVPPPEPAEPAPAPPVDVVAVTQADPRAGDDA